MTGAGFATTKDDYIKEVVISRGSTVWSSIVGNDFFY